MIEIEREETLSRIASGAGERVLALQDTTSFNFAHHPETKGLGVIEDNHTAGFFAHSTLVVSEEGVPLGLLDQQVWIRAKQTKKKTRAYESRPITEKESMKWLKGLHQTQGSVKQVITIADRESDIYEFFQEAHVLGRDYIVRATANRCLVDGDKLHDALEQCEFIAYDDIEVRSAVTQEKRIAEVGIRYTTIELHPPQNRPKSTRVMPLTPLRVQVVEVIEVNAPSPTEAIHWILYTSLAVESLTEALYIVQLYSRRWLVERFHYVLKSGCKMESCQLRTYDALTHFLALCSHQAWKLLELTYQARLTPDASCDAFLTPEQWQALQAHRTQSVESYGTCPTLEEAVRWIAQLGGFLGRKGDGHPGVNVLWKGWQRLNDLAAIWKLLYPPPLDVGKA